MQDKWAKWDKFVELVESREAQLVYGAVVGALVVMMLKTRPVKFIMISDEIMNYILEYNGIKIVPK